MMVIISQVEEYKMANQDMKGLKYSRAVFYLGQILTPTIAEIDAALETVADVPAHVGAVVQIHDGTDLLVLEKTATNYTGYNCSDGTTETIAA